MSIYFDGRVFLPFPSLKNGTGQEILAIGFTSDNSKSNPLVLVESVVYESFYQYLMCFSNCF